MTVRERMLALRLLEKQERNPAYMKALGVSVSVEQRPGGRSENTETPGKKKRKGERI